MKAPSLTMIETGVAAIRSCLQTVPDMAGCYRMLDENQKILYIGKAKHLPHRLASYTRFAKLPLRTRRMIAQTRRVEFTVTYSEAEALLMEANLIRRYKPRFNVLLKDDKAFAQILIRRNHPFPHIGKFRGQRSIHGDYFGPFSNTRSLHQTITSIQKAFLLRNCSDRTFAGRQRPCLEFQIKRCSAPCVGYVSQTQYLQQVNDACRFLRGQDKSYRQQVVLEMENAAQELNFEKAIELRNRLLALTHVQGRQDIHLPDIDHCDLIVFVRENGYSCLQVFFFRDGQNSGHRPYFPKHETSDSDDTIIESFLAQFYTRHKPPPLVLLDTKINGANTLQDALSRLRNEPVRIATAASKYRATVKLARANAGLALKRRISEQTNIQAVYHHLQSLLGLENDIVRIEVFDNAHLQGGAAVGGMIVAGRDGFVKAAYRHFQFKTAEKQDDYAMMAEMLSRRFALPKQRDDDIQDYLANLPDLIIIDGGKGHLRAAETVLKQLEIDTLPVIAAAKGADRIATEFYCNRDIHTVQTQPDADETKPSSNQIRAGLLQPPESLRLYLNQLQDEAHRFANHLHRRKRAKDTIRSALDNVPGIGPQRKKALIRHFGSAKAVASAKPEDLQQVAGLSGKLAQTVHDYLNQYEPL